MSEDPAVAVVARHRGQMVGLAYRILGSVSDAEDAVQEALVALEAHGLAGIDDPGAWLARVTARRCYDRLREAQRRREVYIGPWLPEPLVTEDSPEERAELADSLSMAFLLVLEVLSPAERVAFLLHDVFGYSHADVSAALGRSEEACRALTSRARKAVQARRPRYEPDLAQRDAVAQRFLAACLTGELAPLIEVLAPDVVLRSDGGGVVSAARQPVVGADRVARFFLGVFRQAPAGLAVDLVHLNGTLGVIGRRADGSVDTAFVLDVAGDHVTAVNAVRNPAKLAHLVP